jgi:hypothetical protein
VVASVAGLLTYWLWGGTCRLTAAIVVSIVAWFGAMAGLLYLDNLRGVWTTNRVTGTQGQGPGPCLLSADTVRPGSAIEGQDTLYEFDLTAAPSPAWRAVFFRPPPAARPPTYPRHWPRCDSRAHGAFPRCARHFGGSLRRIDRWIAYANSVVEDKAGIRLLAPRGYIASSGTSRHASRS